MYGEAGYLTRKSKLWAKDLVSFDELSASQALCVSRNKFLILVESSFNIKKTSGGRSAGIVRLWTKPTEFNLFRI
jgi:hypothetical protein